MNSNHLIFQKWHIPSHTLRSIAQALIDLESWMNCYVIEYATKLTEKWEFFSFTKMRMWLSSNPRSAVCGGTEGWEVEKSEVMHTTQGFKVSLNTCILRISVCNRTIRGLLNPCILLAKSQRMIGFRSVI